MRGEIRRKNPFRKFPLPIITCLVSCKVLWHDHDQERYHNGFFLLFVWEIRNDFCFNLKTRILI